MKNRGYCKTQLKYEIHCSHQHLHLRMCFHYEESTHSLLSSSCCTTHRCVWTALNAQQMQDALLSGRYHKTTQNDIIESNATTARRQLCLLHPPLPPNVPCTVLPSCSVPPSVFHTLHPPLPSVLAVLTPKSSSFYPLCTVQIVGGFHPEGG